MPLFAYSDSLRDGARVLRAPPRVSLGFVALFAAMLLGRAGMTALVVTAVGILYSFMFGAVSRFLGWSATMGALLDFIVYAISAFSVSPLCEARAKLAQAVAASARGPG
ncbi:MAG: hypothetical protein IPL80_00925 [Sterolibacteriaceae bacterium]|nr:hypothetical protein [Sterolibacteriaceae bacterium]